MLLNYTTGIYLSNVQLAQSLLSIDNNDPESGFFNQVRNSLFNLSGLFLD